MARFAYQMAEDEDKPLDPIRKVAAIGLAACFAGFVVIESQTPYPHFADFANRRPLAEQAFRDNGLEIVGTQSREEAKPAFMPQTYSDCYTLKKIADDGSRYTGCSEVSTFANEGPHVKITLPNLSP